MLQIYTKVFVSENVDLSIVSKFGQLLSLKSVLCGFWAGVLGNCNL